MATLLTGRVDRIPQELPGSICAHGNPAGRKPLRRKVSGLRGFPQARFRLEAERPNDRTADDHSGKNTHEEDCKFHDASFKKSGGITSLAGERDTPARVEKPARTVAGRETTAFRAQRLMMVDPLTQVHGARCLDPSQTLRGGLTISSPKPMLRYPAARVGRDAPLMDRRNSRSRRPTYTNHLVGFLMLFVSSPQLGLSASEGVTHIR